ncbi:MAG TPA: ABC transporter permease [Candidatus Acidoferrales bacterium]|nr:ABC transporter permease [Candidatus Acidoferrales bacterium]
MSNFLGDIRYGIRVLAKSPGFTVFAVVVLALGIAANTAIFSIADAILMRPLPYYDASRLVMVWEDATSYGFPRDTPAPGNFAEWKARNQVFEDMAATSSDKSYNLTNEGNPEELFGRNVTANLFSVLGVAPAPGRDFRTEDDVPGAARVAILSYGLWVRRFGGEERAVGKEIWLDGEKFTIIGVTPRGFQFPDRKSELWTPIRFTKQQLANHGSHFLEVVARLKPGVSLATANANLATIAKQLEKEHPEDNQKVGAVAVPLREELAGNMRAAVLVLLGAVCFVLLIACANVANLLLARASGRRRELAMRLTLGASRARIARQMLTESILLAAIAGAAGVLLATFGTPFLARLIPPGIAPLTGAGVDGRVLAFAVALSVTTGILFGIVPALRVSQIDLVTSLKQGGGQSGVGFGGGGLRDVLVVAEVALALVLLAGATLMIRSFEALYRADVGFRPDHVLVMRTPLPSPKYAEFSRRTSFYDGVLTRVAALPGVVSAGYTSWIPLTNTGGASAIRLEGHPAPPPGHELIPNVRFVSTGYVRALGMKLIDGRTFDQRDGADTQPVALINQTMARNFWSGENPIGQRFHKGDDTNRPWITVVGIVGDVHQVALDQPARPEMYMLYQQQKSFEEGDFNPEYLAVRTALDPMQMAEIIRQQVWAVDKEQAVANVMPLEELVDDKLAPRKMQTSLLGGFAALALLLATLGIYAVLSFAVTQRTQEIGVRAALGAEPADILRMVLSQGMKLFVVGAAIGLAAAFALSQVIVHLLYGVSATDPLSFTGVTVLLAGVTMLACYIPARRAMRVDPLVALRYE